MKKLILLDLGVRARSRRAASAQDDDPDLDLSVSQPDFTVVTLPTTLRLPRFKSAFRVTHRFGRPLGDGDFGDLAGDLFGLDSGAQIGLEYRFGLMRGLQAGIHRTSNKTIEFFSQYNVMQQSGSRPVALGVLASIDGTNNFRDSYSPALGVAISRTLGSRGAVYVEPIWVNNSNPEPRGAGRRQQHGPDRRSPRGCACARRSTWWAKSCRASPATILASRTARSESKSAPAVIRSS